MKPAVVDGQCRLVGHCAKCREDARWRAETGTPEICPHGYTADNLPAPGFRVRMRRIDPATGKPCGTCRQPVVTFRSQSTH